MVGLRGVGKTVLLDRIRDDAEATGIQTLRIEAPEGRSLPAILAPELRRALLRLSRNEQARELAHRALRGLAGVAIAKPAAAEGVEVNDDALERIVDTTHGYPYFLQEWGKHAWDTADASPITVDDVERGSVTATAALDSSFFSARFDRLTPSEKRYLRAMAELGPELSDVDGNTEDRRGTFSVFNGPAPGIQVLGSVEEECKAVSKWLSDRSSEGVHPHEIGVFVRSDKKFE